MANSSRSAEKESFWRLALSEFHASGLTVRAFCAREGLSEQSFYTWRRTLRQRDAEKRGVADDQVELVPVDVVKPATRARGFDGLRASQLEIATPSGLTLRFHADIEPRHLDVVLGVIAHGKGAAAC